MTVKDLILAAARGEKLPEEIVLKSWPGETWIRFGDAYYCSGHSLGDFVAFSEGWLNDEIVEAKYEG